MQLLLNAVFAGTLLIGASAYAQVTEFQPNMTELSDDVTYNVNADGTYVRDQTFALRINTDQAIKRFSQIPMRFSPALQDQEVLEAYTTTKDGKRIDVAPDKIVLQQSPESANAPMFDDNKVKVVIFPAVELGSTLTLHTRKIQKKALFPGQFSAIDSFSSDFDRQSTRVTVVAPATLKLYVEAIDLKGGQIDSGKPDVQKWQWTLTNVRAHAPEVGSVAASDHSPRLALSTFANFEAVGAAYLDRAKPKAAVTPDVQKLADKLTAGVTDRRTQADILYRWVSAHIRYVAIYLDFGGVVPHDAQSILDADYGDCKDHTTILEALFAAKGIQSSPVLVNATQRYWLPKVASPEVFDHAITYIPEFKLFVDSTAGLAMFGTLPITELGKQALVTDDGSGSAKIVSLPLSNPNNDKVNIAMTLMIDRDGNVKGSSEINDSGEFDWVSRQIFASLPAGVESQFANYVLKGTGQDGTGSFKHGDIRDLTTPLRYKSEFRLPNYVQLPGPGAMTIPKGLDGISDIAAAFESCGPESRDFPVPLIGRDVSETIVINLPDGVKVPNLPKSVNIASQFGTYQSTYAAVGQTITVTRKFDLTLPGPLLQPDQYPELRKMAQTVMHDLRAQLIY